MNKPELSFAKRLELDITLWVMALWLFAFPITLELPEAWQGVGLLIDIAGVMAGICYFAIGKSGSTKPGIPRNTQMQDVPPAIIAKHVVRRVRKTPRI